IFWLLFFSISITALIVKENRSKELEERKHFAENIAKKTDLLLPTTMSITLSDFGNKQFNQIFEGFKNPIRNKILKDSLVDGLFTGFLNKYETKIYTYDALQRALYNEDSTSFNSLNSIILTQGKPTGVANIYNYDVSFDRFDYIGKKEITDSSGTLLGYIFLISKPKDFESGINNPEFFSKKRNNTIESSTIYSYAVYENHLLTVSHNDYQFASSINSNLFSPTQNYISIHKNGYDELWYKANKNKVIVIVKSDRLFIESTTLFAYLFCSFLLSTLFFNVINHLLSSRQKINQYFSFDNLTIRSQIHIIIILITVFSFLIIGITTILFFINRYQSNTQDNLSRSIHIMKNELYDSMDSTSLSEFNKISDNYADKKIDDMVKRVSDIHLVDINLYDLNGDLKVSSVPFPYQKGILSKKMDPIAFYHLHEMKNIQFFQEQKIGTLKYLSNYLPVKDKNEKTFAYLNIPYFDSQNNLEDQISNFLVTIINLNAFIFIIAGIIALFITNRITRSFSLISNKMRKINLQTSNEEIVWNRNDEIGELVKEYNKMVRQLDIGAKTLAKREREDAWSEMARQVAHEIKNPLTPMKLNLQYLQMAIADNEKDLKMITTRVAEIILRQIDHLAQIASDFAQFANIDNFKLQKFDVNEVLENVISLYATNEKVHINTQLYHNKIIIEADNTQINRLFTNLLQNAVQAVPEDRKVIIKIISQLKNNKILISVKDNGNGIPAAMIDKIFTPNFTTKTSGTGLGLAMCRGIIEKVNGKIWFETKENEGTTFYVELPIIS
ncbi:MAG: HAMP domain-containing sensor histidine kinase, partial [Ginsengibacter sp.]